MIHHLVYVSEKAPNLTDAQIDEIVAASKKENEDLSLTGILLTSGNFMVQLIEGKLETVKATYEKILKDPRHVNPRTILTHYSQRRLFPESSMSLMKDPTGPGFKEIIPHLSQVIALDKDGMEKLLSAFGELKPIKVPKKKVRTEDKEFKHEE